MTEGLLRFEIVPQVVSKYRTVRRIVGAEKSVTLRSIATAKDARRDELMRSACWEKNLLVVGKELLAQRAKR